MFLEVLSLLQRWIFILISLYKMLTTLCQSLSFTSEIYQSRNQKVWGPLEHVKTVSRPSPFWKHSGSDYLCSALTCVLEQWAVHRRFICPPSTWGIPQGPVSEGSPVRQFSFESPWIPCSIGLGICKAIITIKGCFWACLLPLWTQKPLSHCSSCKCLIIFRKNASNV